MKTFLILSLLFFLRGEAFFFDNIQKAISSVQQVQNVINQVSSHVNVVKDVASQAGGVVQQISNVASAVGVPVNNVGAISDVANQLNAISNTVNQVNNQVINTASKIAEEAKSHLEQIKEKFGGTENIVVFLETFIGEVSLQDVIGFKTKVESFLQQFNIDTSGVNNLIGELEGLVDKGPDFRKDVLNDVVQTLLVAGNHIKPLGEFLQKFIKLEPTAYMNPCEIISSRGYTCVTYEVKTDDGYVLDLHRLPRTGATTVLLMHGLLTSSVEWVLNPKSQSLPFILWDAGYDVWLGNFRGNTFSKRHVTLDSSSRVFWDFTWDEMGQYDLPAIVDKVLTESGNSDLYYVGYSQGSLVGLTQFGVNSALDGKIKRFYALAPAYELGHLTSPLKFIAPFSAVLQELSLFMGYDEFAASNALTSLLAAGCAVAKETTVICNNAVFLLAGSDATNLNVSAIPTYLAHVPSGTSVKNLAHFGQLVSRGVVAKFDYGYDGNKETYGSTIPPEYDITKMNVPIVIFYGGSDKVVVKQDVESWRAKLSAGILQASYYLPTYDHLDFVWAYNANTKVYSYIVSDLAKTERLRALNLDVRELPSQAALVQSQDIFFDDQSAGVHLRFPIYLALTFPLLLFLL